MGHKLLGGERRERRQHHHLFCNLQQVHSVSFLHFATPIDELHFDHHHQSQITIMAMRLIAHIVFLPPSSTSNPSSLSFVLLPNCLQAAQPPILSTHCFGIGACPSNFASNVEYALGGGGVIVGEGV